MVKVIKNGDGLYKSRFIKLVFASFAFAAIASTNAQAVELTPREAYTFGQICAYCHARAETSAPVIGDTEEWQRRSADGFEVLVTNTILGVGNMPPLGTCGYCTEDEIRNLVIVMSGLDPAAANQGVKP